MPVVFDILIATMSLSTEPIMCIYASVCVYAKRMCVSSWSLVNYSAVFLIFCFS